jgi:predicted XRE-type DNA-binding protein
LLLQSRLMAMARKQVSKGTDNVLLDLGFDDALDLSVKAVLVIKLNELIGQLQLNQAEAARLTGTSRLKVSQ